MLPSRTRAATIAGVLGLLAGGLVLAPGGASAVQVVPRSGAGSIVVWGGTDTSCTTPVNETLGAAGGPWTAVSSGSSGGDADRFSISAAGKGVRVKDGGTPALAVPEALAGETAVAVSSYGSNKAGAVTSTGAVQIWGSTRGVAPRRWEPAELGGKAVDVAIGSTSAAVLLEDGTVGQITAFPPPDGPYTKIAGVENGAEVQTEGDGFVVRIKGGGLRQFTTAGEEITDSLPSTVRGDTLADPVVAFTPNKMAVTQSGAVHGWTNDPRLDDFVVPASAGKAIDVAGANGYYAALTDTNNIVLWDQLGESSPCYEAMTTLPEALEGKRITNIGDGVGAFTAIAADPLVPLSVTATPTVTGTPQVGSVLTGTPATFGGQTDSEANRWLAGGTPITGATGTALVLTQAELGKTIVFESTATRGADSLVSSSTPTGPVAAAPAGKVAATITAGGATQATFGSAVTATAAVAGANGAPTGTVTFSGPGINATAAVSGGQAAVALPATLPVGSYSVTATYSGDAKYLAASTSKVLTITKASTSAVSAKVTKKPKKNKAGKVQVTASSASSVAPGGKVKVTITKGKKKYTRTGTLRGGKIVITLPKLAKGTWKIRAQYNGDSGHTARSSKWIKVKVK